MVNGIAEAFIKVKDKVRCMEQMSMVLVIRYEGEQLCSPTQMTEWFESKSYKVGDTKIVGEQTSFEWAHMKMVNTLMFVVNTQEDVDFPSILFDFILNLKSKDTIVSLAEESQGGYKLVFEANLERFIKELVSGE